MPVIRLLAVAAAGALLAGPALAATADFPRGSWSVGAHGGLALVSMDDLNRVLALTPAAGYDELGRAWDTALDVRYGLPDQVHVGLEVGWLRGRAEPGAPGYPEVEASGFPVLVTAGKALAMPSETVVRIVGGVGALVAGTLDPGGAKDYAGTGFVAVLGGELEYRVARGWALTAEAFARQCKVKEPGGLGYDLDFSGGGFRAAVRGYFGGRER